MKTLLKRLHQRKLKRSEGRPIRSVQFKNFDTNINYIISVNKTDTVDKVKDKLVNIANLEKESIILIHKNRVLVDSMLFSVYHVTVEDFVLFNSQIEDSLCYTYGYLDEKSYFDRVCNECVNVNNRERYNNMFLNGGQIVEIEILKRDVSANRIKVNNAENIFEAFQRRFPDFLNCFNCKYEILVFGRRIITEYDTFAYFNLHNDDVICQYTFEKIEKNHYLISAQLICVTNDFPKFEVNLHFNIKSLLDYISNKIKIPGRNISLFIVIDELEIPISNEILMEFVNNGNENIIYYRVQLFQQYAKLARLKLGSFGSLMKCYSIITKSQVAIKELKGISIENELLLANELERFKQLDHPNILKIEYFETYLTSTMYITNFMEKGSLEKFLKQYGQPSEHTIKNFSKQILQGLQYLHGNQIFHMNIKESNILLDQFYNIKLSDFGLSKILFDLSTKDKLNGLIQSYNQSYLYTAPEILNGKPFSSQSDIWSFGVVLVGMLKVFQPYYKRPAYEVMKQISMLNTFNYQYPENRSETLKSFIDSCLNAQPQNRLTIDQLLNHNFLI